MMRIAVLKMFPLLLLWILLALACERVDDGTPPVLTLLLPDNNTEYAVGDSIHVVGTVTHKFPIRSVKVSLLNKQNIPVLPPEYLFPDAYGYNIDLKYPIDDPGLETGSYTLQVSASDGHNTVNAWRTLGVNGIPRNMEGLIAICVSGNLKTIVYAIDSSAAYTELLSLQHGYTASAINSSSGMLYLVRPEPSGLKAYELDGMEEAYTFEAAPPFPVFYDLYHEGGLSYLATGNGGITGVDGSGSAEYVTPLNNDSIPRLVFKHQNHVIAYCERRGGPEKYFRQYYAGTGVFRAGLQVDFTAVSLFNLDESHMIVTGNKEGESGIYTFDVANNFFTAKKDMPPGGIVAAVQLAAWRYMIAHTAGIYHYDHTSQYLSEYMPGMEADALAYDDTGGLLFIGRGAVIGVYEQATAGLLQEITLPHEIVALHIRYNR
jgi:hypothetical protein